MRGPGPPSIHTKTWSPQRRPAHQKTQSNIMRLGTPRSTAATIDAWPIRARAPMLMIDAVEPRSSSSSAGCDATSAGTSGSITSGTIALAAIPADDHHVRPLARVPPTADRAAGHRGEGARTLGDRRPSLAAGGPLASRSCAASTSAPVSGPLHENDPERCVVVLPGMQYSTQAPLLWFAREVAAARRMERARGARLAAGGAPIRSAGRATARGAPSTGPPRRRARSP